jgi:hypothetical protein
MSAAKAARLFDRIAMAVVTVALIAAMPVAAATFVAHTF